MIYLITGDDSIVAKEIDDIIKDNKIDDNSISRYDLEINSINDAILDIDTMNIFQGKKVVIVEKIELALETEEFIKYLNNQNDNILILVGKSLDYRKKLTKEIKKKAKFIDAANIDLFNYIKEELKDYKINYLTIVMLKDYCGNDYFRLKNEMEKLKMYKKDTMEILDSDVKKLVKKPLDSNVFDLVDAINKKDYKEIYDIYYDLKQSGEDELKLISVLANHFRLLYRVKYYMLNNNDEQVISLLKLHPYRFKMLKQASYSYESLDLLRYLKDLSELDIRVKTGLVDKKIGMELFFSRI